MIKQLSYHPSCENCCNPLHDNFVIILYSKKLGRQKSLVNIDDRKFGGKNVGELKSVCIGNVMKIVKIGEKLGELL